MTLVASALAGGDCIDDAHALRTGGTCLHPGRHGQGALHLWRLSSQVPLGPRLHGHTGKRGYHQLPAIAAGTTDVLMPRLREGRANTARGAAHFLCETVGRVCYRGASGQITVRADSGSYTHGVDSVCRKPGVGFSITIGQHKGLRNLIETILEADWRPITAATPRLRTPSGT